jgi:hypothetical protein
MHKVQKLLNKFKIQLCQKTVCGQRLTEQIQKFKNSRGVCVYAHAVPGTYPIEFMNLLNLLILLNHINRLAILKFKEFILNLLNLFQATISDSFSYQILPHSPFQDRASLPSLTGPGLLARFASNDGGRNARLICFTQNRKQSGSGRTST